MTPLNCFIIAFIIFTPPPSSSLSLSISLSSTPPPPPPTLPDSIPPRPTTTTTIRRLNPSVSTSGYTSTTYPTTTLEPSCEGEGIKKDVVFVIDSSGSVGLKNFKLLRQFVYDVISGMDVRRDGVRVAVVTFSSRIHYVSYFNRDMIKSQALRKVAAMRFRPGKTRTNLALQRVQNVIMTSRKGDRPGVDDVIIVVTDGVSVNEDATSSIASSLHQESDVTMLSIGVGRGVRKSEVKSIASDPEFVYFVTDFSALGGLIDEVKRESCRERTRPTTTTKQPPPPTITITATPNTTTTAATTTTSTTSLDSFLRTMPGWHKKTMSSVRRTDSDTDIPASSDRIDNSDASGRGNGMSMLGPNFDLHDILNAIMEVTTTTDGVEMKNQSEHNNDIINPSTTNASTNLSNEYSKVSTTEYLANAFQNTSDESSALISLMNNTSGTNGDNGTNLTNGTNGASSAIFHKHSQFYQPSLNATRQPPESTHEDDVSTELVVLLVIGVCVFIPCVCWCCMCVGFFLWKGRKSKERELNKA